MIKKDSLNFCEVQRIKKVQQYYKESVNSKGYDCVQGKNLL